MSKSYLSPARSTRGRVQPKPTWPWVLAAVVAVVRKERFPYAVAIAVGVGTTLWVNGSLGALLSALGIG